MLLSIRNTRYFQQNADICKQTKMGISKSSFVCNALNNTVVYDTTDQYCFQPKSITMKYAGLRTQRKYQLAIFNYVEKITLQRFECVWLLCYLFICNSCSISCHIHISYILILFSSYVQSVKLYKSNFLE